MPFLFSFFLSSFLSFFFLPFYFFFLSFLSFSLFFIQAVDSDQRHRVVHLRRRARRLRDRHLERRHRAVRLPARGVCSVCDTQALLVSVGLETGGEHFVKRCCGHQFCRTCLASWIHAQVFCVGKEEKKVCVCVGGGREKRMRNAEKRRKVDDLPERSSVCCCLTVRILHPHKVHDGKSAIRCPATDCPFIMFASIHPSH